MRSLVIAAVAAAVTFLAVRATRVDAFETFLLGEHDRIIAETPGCHAECQIQSPTLRTCTVRGFDCRAACMEVPECSAAGKKAPRVCALVKTR